MVLALGALTFSSCDDVPMPYNQPDIKPVGPDTTKTVEPAGSGTAADPYNVAAALQVVRALDAGAQTDEAIYVKGVVDSIREIETERYGNANYYITDNGSESIYIFQSYYLGNRRFTASDPLKKGDTVVVYGKFTNYQGNTPETVGRGTSYIYSLNGKTADDTPTPTPSEPKGDGTQANPYNAAAANKAGQALSSGQDDSKEVYVSGTISNIREVNTSYGNALYYISDDGTTSGEQFYVFRGNYLNGEKFTSESQIKVGQKVVVRGTLTNYNGTIEFKQGSSIVSIEGTGTEPAQPDTPTTGEGVSISGTTLTLTNGAAEAGTETVSIDFNTQGLSNAEDVTSKEFKLSDGTTITFSANGKTNGPKFYTGTKGIRVYLDNTVTFTGVKKIAKIVINCDSHQGTNDVGNAGASVVFTGNNAVYTNSDPSVTSGGGVQLRIQTVTITYAK